MMIETKHDGETDLEYELRRAPRWPDLELDRKAWNRARQELPRGTCHEIAERAQVIKEQLKKEVK